MFAPPFRDPFNYVFDPLIPTGIDLVGAAMHARFAAEGKPGVTMRAGATYSTWWNGGLRTTAYFHNQIGLLTETIGSPTPIEIPFVPERQLPSADLPYPIAPQRWHFRQSIEYSVTANRAVLDVASRYRETLLFNIYRMGTNCDRARQPRHVDVRRIAARSSPARADGAATPTSSCDAAAARSARLHPAVGSAGLPDRDEVRGRAAQDRRRRAPRDRARSPSNGTDVSGRLVRREDGAGVPAARARHVRAAGSSRRHSVSRGAADAAVRQRRVDARVSDGREVRSRARRLRRSVRDA